MPVIRQQLVTTDVGEAATAMEEALDGGAVRLSNAEDFRFGHDYVQGAGIALSTLDFSAQLHSVSQDASAMTVVWTDRGKTAYTAGGRDVGVDATLLWSGRRPVTAAVDDSRVRSIILDRGDVEQRARLLLGRPDFLLPDFTPPRSAADVDALRRHADGLNAFFLADTAADNALLERALTDLTISLVLVSFGLDTTPTSTAGTPTFLRRAWAFIDENLDRPITVADIAAAARVSARTLQDTSRRLTGETPTQRLHRVRMARVRDDLIAADPTAGDTVAAIARRWGFAHLGRFAVRYRESFGESPSETLRT